MGAPVKTYFYEKVGPNHRKCAESFQLKQENYYQGERLPSFALAGQIIKILPDSAERLVVIICQFQNHFSVP
jgi:hypothetical protein